MRVLVAGGAGYIGTHVVRELLEAGHAVTIYDNMSTGSELNMLDGVSFLRGDITDESMLSLAFARGFDAVVHLAALKAAGESMLEPEKYSVNNIEGTLKLLNAAVAAGVKYLVFSSSAAVYGEPEYLPVDEQHPTRPENYYGFTKLEIERFLGWYEKIRGLRFAALRYFNAAGYDVKGRVTALERNPANLLPVIMEVAAGKREKLQVFGNDYDTKDGTGVRDYVHVSDLAQAHVQALAWMVQNDRSLTVNLGSEAGYSVLELLESARRITGRPIPADIVARRPGDPARLVASSALAHEVLGWSARHSDVDSLVRTTWDVYRKRFGLD